MNMQRAIDEMNKPVDPDLFLKMTQIFNDSARKPLPKLGKRSSGLYPTDIPLNRGMAGLVAALRDEHVSEQECSAFMNRIMLMGTVFKNSDRFPRFIKQSPNAVEGAIDVADALLKAMAVAKVVDAERPSFDLDDVQAKAIEFEAQDQQ